MYKKFLITAFASLTATSVLGWGQTGHRITGAIAEQYLTPQARAAIEVILVNESLAEASTYADEMRSNPAHFWQREAGSYHYVTVPKGKRYDEVGAPKRGDSVTALKQFAETLQDPKASIADKQLALKFSVHIIGDLHQPLHAGNGSDRGGNDVALTFFGDPSNLHSVWDSGMIDKRQLSYSEWKSFLSSKITMKQVQQWNQPDPQVWIEESTAIRDRIYPEKDALSWDYLYQHMPTVKQRLQQAGIRMAAYLNLVFGTSGR